ncbi:arylsulfatase [Roseibium alexandrii]|uniref:arylsulfatase n=1 Tax=Roseibium alexandrii TaxID=388408 RepID=UPI003753955A
MKTIRSLTMACAMALPWTVPASAQDAKPNILLIMSDDVGLTNVSAYGEGIVGYETPNIDRILNGGMKFIDYYAEQSCTAGRSAFITGQSPIRTGLLKVGLPGADLGLRKEDPTLATMLKSHGYVSGQFGKNHLGDRNEFLPTVHGFDEFFGNLYHLNAEEEPEEYLYPTDPAFRAEFGPRGVLDCAASDTESDIDDPRFGLVGMQVCEDTGPLTRKRMETADDEFTDRAEAFIRTHTADGTPWMAWVNTSRMHLWTHLKEESQRVTGKGLYADGMMEHDAHVGQLLDVLDELGIAENTMVVYTTDNGPHFNAWPDGGNTPFRGEKNTNWEGGYRVPAGVRWPGVIPEGQKTIEMTAHLDWVPTVMAAVGEPDIKEKLMAGHEINGTEYKVHLDGMNLLPLLKGESDTSGRQEFFYWNDGGQLVGLRRNDWKMVFMEQRAKKFALWGEPFVPLRLPKVFNLRMDPWERADLNANGYDNWRIRQLYTLVPSQVIVREFLSTLEEFPPRQKPAKFNVDDAIAAMSQGAAN